MGSRRFTSEFKLEAVKLVVDRGVPVKQAGRDLGVHANVLHRWIRAYREHGAAAFPGHGKMRREDAEVVRLRRELARAQAERDLEKKAIGYFAKEPKRFAFIAKHRGIWPVRWMCGVLDVSHGGFHKWLRRPASWRSRENQVLLPQVRASFEQSDRTYGSPWVSHCLRRIVT